MMEYKLPELPEPDGVRAKYSVVGLGGETNFYRAGDLQFIGTEPSGQYTDKALIQYAEQAIAPLLAEIERLEDLLYERGVAEDLP